MVRNIATPKVEALWWALVSILSTTHPTRESKDSVKIQIRNTLDLVEAPSQGT